MNAEGDTVAAGMIREAKDRTVLPEAQPAPKTGTTYYASIYPGPVTPLPTALGDSLSKLGAELGLPVWVLLQDDPDAPPPFRELDEELVHAFRHHKKNLPSGNRIALVVNSPGGSARAAYELARLVVRRCGGFLAVVPDAAMSAATLLTLGADAILMGADATLGPLDAQVWDPEAETFSSVLNEVQALERLRAYGLDSIDETMFLLVPRTGKRVESLLPHVLRFVAETMRPLLEKIDVVHYNERARILKVAEEYAIRLLRPKHPEPQHPELPDPARQIASDLVEDYPEHGFRIDREEAQRIGLSVSELPDEQARLLEDLWGSIQGVTAVGRLEEVTTP